MCEEEEDESSGCWWRLKYLPGRDTSDGCQGMLRRLSKVERASVCRAPNGFVAGRPDSTGPGWQRPCSNGHDNILAHSLGVGNCVIPASYSKLPSLDACYSKPPVAGMPTVCRAYCTGGTRVSTAVGAKGAGKYGCTALSCRDEMQYRIVV